MVFAARGMTAGSVYGSVRRDKESPAMQNIIVRRYENNPGWQGWIEPEDKSWIIFLDAAGRPVFFPHRDPVTGAVLDGVPSMGD